MSDQSNLTRTYSWETQTLYRLIIYWWRAFHRVCLCVNGSSARHRTVLSSSIHHLLLLLSPVSHLPSLRLFLFCLFPPFLPLFLFFFLFFFPLLVEGYKTHRTAEWNRDWQSVRLPVFAWITFWLSLLLKTIKKIKMTFYVYFFFIHLCCSCYYGQLTSAACQHQPNQVIMVSLSGLQSRIVEIIKNKIVFKHQQK